MKKITFNGDRRSFLGKSLALIPSLALSTVGMSHATDLLKDAATATPYVPTYFTDDEWLFILAACDQIIPAEAVGAGALAAGVPEFIDRQMNTPYGNGGLWYMHGPFHPDVPPELGYQLKFTPKEIFRVGIEDTNAYCQAHYQQRFDQLNAAQQLMVLTGLESGDIALAHIPAKTFFEYLLKSNKEGYFSDPQYGGNKNMIGWRMIGFPGARADYMDWVSQPNKPYPYRPVSISGRRAV